MAYVRVVPQIDWEIIRKYLDDETLENTAILISEEAAAVSGTDVFDRKLVLNPYEDGNHDVSLYLIGNPQNEILSELKLDDE